MIDTEKDNLGRHIARLTHTVDGWSVMERVEKTAELRVGILALGILMDRQIEKALNNFMQETIGLVELSRILQEKLVAPDA